VKLTGPPSIPQEDPADRQAALLADLKDMRRAVSFASRLLRDELGPGGLMEDEPEPAKKTWMLAIACLGAASDMPMIPLHFWRHPREENQDAQAAEQADSPAA